jgi:N-methylhydantoinase B
MSEMDQIRFQVMWNRLLSVVEEQAQTLVRTAFSTSAREAGDVSAGVFDLDGQMLAQAVTGTPGHINSMARAVIHFLKVFPSDTMQEGDTYITNDPWKGTGHLHDFTVVSPTFKDGVMVALFASTSHVVDIGGIGQSPDGKQIYHEGLFIPIMPLATRGVMNEWLLNLVRANVREPVQVEGDIYALAACNETGSRRLLAMMREYDLESLDELGAHIIDTSRVGMEKAINDMPKGSWTHTMRIDGYESPIDLTATLTIGDGEIVVDYTGSSGTSSYGINCPMCYTEAYTAFGVKCVVAPKIPNNAGTLDAIKVTAPENTIVNAPHPHAVVARATIGQDGLSATPFPSGVRNVPVEITEAITPVVFWRKEFRQNSGGPGKRRGGLGQTMEISNREAAPFGIFATFERVHYPARGREGGAPGANGRVRLGSGTDLKNKGFQMIPAGDRLIIEMPGGGGYGGAMDRDPESVAADVKSQLISPEVAAADYGVIVSLDGVLDRVATVAKRQST